MARATVTVDEDSYVWGHGELGEMLDGKVWLDRPTGEYHYQTFRGVHAYGRRLGAVLNTVAQKLGYSGATLLSSRASHAE